MIRPQPLIAVQDVEASSRWYQAALGAESGHGGADYDRIVRDGDFILQLHAWDAHDHPNLASADDARPGNGVLLWFQTDRFDDALTRVHDLGAEIIEGPKVNANANQREIWLRDPDGYVVVLAGLPGDV